MTDLALYGDAGQIGTLKVNGHFVSEAEYIQLQRLKLALKEVEDLRARLEEQARITKAGAQDKVRQAEQRGDKAVRHAVSLVDAAVKSIVEAAQELNNKSKHMRITTAHISPLMDAVNAYNAQKGKGK